MTDIEKRRLELLTQTKNMYSEKIFPPAIHPRYQAAYHSLYGKNGAEKSKGDASFGIRVAIAILLFAIFFFMHQQKYTVGKVNSQSIVEEIENNLFSEKFPFFIE